MQLDCLYRHLLAQTVCGIAAMDAEPMELKYANAINSLGGCEGMPFNWKNSDGFDLNTSNFWYMRPDYEDVQAKVAQAKALFLAGMGEHNRPVVHTGLFRVTGTNEFVGWVQVINMPSKTESASKALTALLGTAQGSWTNHFDEDG